MKRLFFLHRLTGLIVSAALLLAPLSAHAEAGDAGQTGVLSALSATCLDLDVGAEGGTGHDAAACHACPMGCFGGVTLTGLPGVPDVHSWQHLDMAGTEETLSVQASPDLSRARSPPVA